MQCSHPIVLKRDTNLVTCDEDDRVLGIPHPCGQCLPCRINKRRRWTGRVLMEYYTQDIAHFVTLTYDDLHLPLYYSPDDMTLQPCINTRDVQLFFKRLRKEYPRCKVRYFGCGEYGTRSQRPHYHFIIFGLPDCSKIEDIWSNGLIHVGDVTHDSVQYVAGYTLKKLMKGDLHGRLPERLYSSRKPGIGKLWLESFCSEVQKPKYSGHFIRALHSGTNPFQTVNIAGKHYPMDQSFTVSLFERLSSCSDEWLSGIEEYKSIRRSQLLSDYLGGKRLLRDLSSSQIATKLVEELFSEFFRAGPIAGLRYSEGRTRLKRHFRKAQLFETRRDKV